MDWSKVDAGLAAALAGDHDEGPLAVFVHLSESVEQGVLDDLGVEAAGQGLVRTATVSLAQIARLTDQRWVRQLRLSGSLGLLGGRDP